MWEARDATEFAGRALEPWGDAFPGKGSRCGNIGSLGLLESDNFVSFSVVALIGSLSHRRAFFFSTVPIEPWRDRLGWLGAWRTPPPNRSADGHYCFRKFSPGGVR